MMTFLKEPNLLLFIVMAMLLSCAEETKTENTKEQTKSTNVDETPLTPAAQLAEIMRIWPGTYSNNTQISEVEKNGGDVWRLDDSGEGGYLHVQSHYIQLDRPDLGENVLYVEEYRDQDPAATYRQRIYTLSINDSLNEVRVKMWPFKDKEKYIGAWKDSVLLSQIKANEISAYPDFCDLRVRKESDVYVMYMNDKDCAFGTKYYSYQVMLTKDRYSFRDKITLIENDSVVSTAANFTYHHLDRTE